MAQSSNSVPVTVSGENFEVGAAVTDSSPGVMFASITVVSTTEITALVSVTHGAEKRQTNVTVENPDGVSGTCTSCLQIVAHG